MNQAHTCLQKNKGAPLPQFDDLLDGTVLNVHCIWAMRVYDNKLEYKGNKIRGEFKYEIQDHFGLDSNDINHPNLLATDRNLFKRFIKGLANKFELLSGFRSWYLL
ncbi:DUF3289 family protein [Vibrio sp. TRT 17S01]|uniref:DUF3289 family protein n=1 Tax=Vibrio sp. TRT 17S01 TaxID=3418505 RepID=UPI003CF07397